MKRLKANINNAISLPRFSDSMPGFSDLYSYVPSAYRLYSAPILLSNYPKRARALCENRTTEIWTRRGITDADYPKKYDQQTCSGGVVLNYAEMIQVSYQTNQIYLPIWIPIYDGQLSRTVQKHQRYRLRFIDWYDSVLFYPKDACVIAVTIVRCRCSCYMENIIENKKLFIRIAIGHSIILDKYAKLDIIL